MPTALNRLLGPSILLFRPIPEQGNDVANVSGGVVGGHLGDFSYCLVGEFPAVGVGDPEKFGYDGGVVVAVEPVGLGPGVLEVCAAVCAG